MEQASNTFSRGLQTDTNPMIQGNDSLSDALNATFVTMNGNEVILQNDMGNRRVDNAFLPAGYQPVGMKEYGGIIYVAAYNPITNRSQIGSFPSLERKRGSEYSDLKGELDFNKFSNEDNYFEEDNIKFLRSDTMLIKLTGDTSLHAGDKFSVYCNQYANFNSEKITNFNNTKNNKIISPKNKTYTLSLGILNSQNEFVDITKTLQRWKTTEKNNKISEIINFDDNISELYKFNSGYFIAASAPNGIDYTKSKNDREFLAERQKLAVNTYSYKLVGPLYIKTQLNHIQNASYNIYGIKEKKENKTIVTLWVESVITYNCPDGIKEIKKVDNEDEIIISGFDDNYATYALSSNNNNFNNFPGFDFKGINVTLNLTKDSTKYSNHSYNTETNLYTVTILKEYTCDNPTENIIEYYYCIPTPLKTNEETIYLKGLSEKGSINTSLLGSGQIDITGWRFYNEGKEGNYLTTLTYNLSSYPKYKHSFRNLKFTFINVENDDDKVILSQNAIYNGRNTVQFNRNYKKNKFKERSLYKVKISYRDYNDETGDYESKEIESNKWFLTTKLFNNCYISSHEDYMADFSDANKESIRNKYLTIELELITSFINQSEEKTVSNNGKILSKLEDLIKINDENYIYIEYKHEQPISIKGEFSLKIKNEELYPKYIKLSNSESIINIDDKSIEMNTEELIDQIDYYANHEIEYPIKKDENNESNEYKKIIETDAFSVSNNNIITGKITYYDKFLSKAKSAENLQVTNGFTSIEDAVKKLVDQTQNGDKQYTGIYMNFHERGGDDYHVLNSAVNNSKEFDIRIDYDWGNPPGGIQIDRGDDNGRIDFDVKKNYNKIIEEFNKANPSNPFIWLGLDGTNTNWECWASQKNWGGAGSEYPKDKKYARIWWKTANLNYPWVLLEKYATSSNSISTTILDHFVNPENIYICFYKQTTLKGFYIPDKGTYNYNYKYDFNPVLSFKIIQSSSSSISENPSDAPIKFKLSDSLLEQDTIYNELSINSSDLFQNIVSNSDNIITDNIDIDTGLNLDFENNPLSINNVYIKTNEGKLKKNYSSKITPNFNYYGGQYYGFVYGNSSTYTPGSPNNTDEHCYMYDFVGDGQDGDSDTVLAYNSINIVKKGYIDG